MAKLNEFKEVRHIDEFIYAMFDGEPELEDGVLYVVDNSPYVEYNCPCGCGRVVTIHTTKQSAEYNGWNFEERNGKVTLSPSVYSTGFPCRSHYFIQNNRIIWC